MHDHRPGRTARADRRTRKRHHQAGLPTRQGPAETSEPLTAEMIKRGLIVGCEEMFYAFGRTAMSPVIYEVLDYAVGIANADGELVAQTPGVPGFSGVLDFVASDVLEKWRKEMRPGDVYVLNVPYRSGTHLNDFALVLPSFHKDDLLGLIINKGLPKGTFEAEDYIDDDGITEDPLYVKAKVTISDDAFVVDFTGSAPQGKGSINSPLPGTVSGVRETYMAVMDPHALANAGFFRPIRVIAPEGSVFHAVRPAPTSTYWESMSYSVDLVWKALAPHVPDRLSSG